LQLLLMFTFTGNETCVAIVGKFEHARGMCDHVRWGIIGCGREIEHVTDTQRRSTRHLRRNHILAWPYVAGE
jgi:hypothetical protein